MPSVNSIHQKKISTSKYHDCTQSHNEKFGLKTKLTIDREVKMNTKPKQINFKKLIFAFAVSMNMMSVTP